jgi:hypothetical protein
MNVPRLIAAAAGAVVLALTVGAAPAQRRGLPDLMLNDRS